MRDLYNKGRLWGKGSRAWNLANKAPIDNTRDESRAKAVESRGERTERGRDNGSICERIRDERGFTTRRADIQKKKKPASPKREKKK